MFGDPQTLTVNSVAQACNRLGTGLDEAAYKTSDGLFGLSIRHRKLAKKRVLHQVQFSQQILAADPMDPTVNALSQMGVTLTCNVPDAGYIPVATQKLLVDAFLVWLAASSGAAVTKLLGGES